MNPFESDIYDINLPIRQSHQIGDCWLLSALYSLAQSTIGQDILKEAVENNFIETTVNFKGIDTTISIDNDEIAQAMENNKYSRGSKSFIIFELAFEKLREKISKGEVVLPEEKPYYLRNDFTIFKNKLSGGRPAEAFYYLTGNAIHYLSSNDYNGFSLFENAEGIVACCSFDIDKDYPVVDYYGNETNLISKHAYSIKSVDKNFISIVNPHNTDVEIFLDRLDFYTFLKSIEYCQL